VYTLEDPEKEKKTGEKRNRKGKGMNHTRGDKCQKGPAFLRNGTGRKNAKRASPKRKGVVKQSEKKLK